MAEPTKDASNEPLVDLAKDVFKGTGSYGIGLGALVGWLWSSAWFHWMPALLVLAASVWTLLFQKRLPFFGNQWEALNELNQGKNQHPTLRGHLEKALGQAAAPLVLSSQHHVPTAPAQGRWQGAMAKAGARLDAAFGQPVFSYPGFQKLWLFALVYPIVFMLLVWAFTGVGSLGTVQLLGPIATDWQGPAWRFAVLGLALWPLAVLAWAKKKQPRLMDNHGRLLSSAGLLLAFGPPVLGFAAAVIGWVPDEVGLAFAFAVAGAVAGAFAGAFAFAFAFAGAGAVAVALWVIPRFEARSLQRLRQAPSNGAGQARAHCGQVLLWVLLAVGCMALGTLAPFSPWAHQDGPDRLIAMWLYLFGWMPICNALFDWLSLGITRLLLAKMPKSASWAVGGMVLDTLAAIALTLVLFAVAFSVMGLMDACGWKLGTYNTLKVFAVNPIDPAVLWVAMLAVTNLLPTLWHLCVGGLSLIERQWVASEDTCAHMRSLLARTNAQGGPLLGAAAQGLGKMELFAVFNSLYVHRWLYGLGTLALVIGLWGSYLELLRWWAQMLLSATQ